MQKHIENFDEIYDLPQPYEITTLYEEPSFRDRIKIYPLIFFCFSLFGGLIYLLVELCKSF